MNRTHAPAMRPIGLICIAMALAAPGTAAQSTLRCPACHAELEMLRQHTRTLEEAQKLHVPVATLAASAHAGMECSDCHTGYRRHPHEPGGSTSSCGSCHQEEQAAWAQGIHASEGDADCTDCHGVHDVMRAEQMEETAGSKRMESACTACHFEPRARQNDPHADQASCPACHAPHRTLGPANPDSRVHPLNQGATCGACHDTIAAAWSGDVHGEAVPRLASEDDHSVHLNLDAHLDPPACTGCHGAHDMLTPEAIDFPQLMAGRCSHCHEAYAESFADSYHGQATELGSERVATCHECHGAHDVYPASDPRSSVSEGRLLGTCRGCHPDATAGFALFQPHADHGDRDRYPYAYWAYHLMTALLIGTFTVFGAHTVLWLLRLSFDALRGSGHTPTEGD